MMVEHQTKPSSPLERAKGRGGIALIALALLVWGGIIGWGIIRNQPELDLRKPLILVGVILSFLGVWLILLWSRRAKS